MTAIKRSVEIAPNHLKGFNMSFTRGLVPAILALSCHGFVAESAFSQDAPHPSLTLIESIDALAEPTPVPPKGLSENTVYNIVARHSGQCLDVSNYGLNNGDRLQQWYCTGDDNQKFKLVYNFGQWQLVGVQSGKTVSLINYTYANGAIVNQWDNYNGANQQLLISPLDNGAYSVHFNNSDKCLDVSGVSLSPGAKVQQWDCVNGANQEWFFRPAKNFPSATKEYKLISRASGKCLDVAGRGLYNGAPLQQWTCVDQPNQKFRIVNLTRGRFQIVAVESGKTVSVDASSLASGAKVHQWDLVSSTQFVSLYPSVDGGYSIFYPHSNKCLDVEGFSTADGAVIQQWDCANTQNQIWLIQE
jgi:hypothetical protein